MSSSRASCSTSVTSPRSALSVSKKSAAVKALIDKSCKFSLRFEHATEPSVVNQLLVPLLKVRDVKQVVRKSLRHYHLIFKTVDAAKEFRENSADRCQLPANRCAVRWFGLPVKEVEIRRLQKGVSDEQIRKSLARFGRVISIDEWRDEDLEEHLVNKKVVFELESLMPSNITIDHTPGTVIYSKPLLRSPSKRSVRPPMVVE